MSKSVRVESEDCQRMGGGHFDALEMLLLMRLRTKSRLSPTHCVRPGRDALSQCAGGAHIATRVVVRRRIYRYPRSYCCLSNVFLCLEEFGLGLDQCGAAETSFEYTPAPASPISQRRHLHNFLSDNSFWKLTQLWFFLRESFKFYENFILPLTSHTPPPDHIQLDIHVTWLFKLWYFSYDIYE